MQISAIERQLQRLERSNDTDIDAFLPPDKKRFAVNPLGHCLGKPEQKSQTSSSSQSANKAKHNKMPHHKFKS